MKMRDVGIWGVVLMVLAFVWLFIILNVNELIFVSLWPVIVFMLGQGIVLLILKGKFHWVGPTYFKGTPLVGTIKEHFVYTHKRIHKFSLDTIVFIDNSKVMIDENEVIVNNVSEDWPIYVLNHKGKQVYPER